MAKVITVSRKFPAGHPRAGEDTFFVEKIWKSFLGDSSPMFPYWMKDHPSGADIRDACDFAPKLHTIRSGEKPRFKVGDMVSIRVWTDKPYRSKQIAIAPDIPVKRVAKVEIMATGVIYIDYQWVADMHFYDGNQQILTNIAQNDGLTVHDMRDWFSKLPFTGYMYFFTDAQTPY